MISVIEAANILEVSPSRVRALIASDALPAQKVGRSWVLEEKDVVQRLSSNPRGGRPRSLRTDEHPPLGNNHLEHGEEHLDEMHSLYLRCKKHLSVMPTSELIGSAQSHEEASFYISVSDFFLRQRQHELIDKGVF